MEMARVIQGRQERGCTGKQSHDALGPAGEELLGLWAGCFMMFVSKMVRKQMNCLKDNNRETDKGHEEHSTGKGVTSS